MQLCRDGRDGIDRRSCSKNVRGAEHGWRSIRASYRTKQKMSNGGWLTIAHRRLHLASSTTIIRQVSSVLLRGQQKCQQHDSAVAFLA